MSRIQNKSVLTRVPAGQLASQTGGIDGQDRIGGFARVFEILSQGDRIDPCTATSIDDLNSFGEILCRLFGNPLIGGLFQEDLGPEPIPGLGDFPFGRTDRKLHLRLEPVRLVRGEPAFCKKGLGERIRVFAVGPSLVHVGRG